MFRARITTSTGKSAKPKCGDRNAVTVYSFPDFARNWESGQCRSLVLQVGQVAKNAPDGEHQEVHQIRIASHAIHETPLEL